MGNIQTPRKVLKRGKESWLSKKDKKSSQATKFERTGKETFNVHHDDGSVFECKIDPTKVQLKEDGLKSAGGSSKFFLPNEIRARNVMSNEDRRKLGLEPDPELPN